MKRRGFQISLCLYLFLHAVIIGAYCDEVESPICDKENCDPTVTTGSETITDKTPTEKQDISNQANPSAVAEEEKQENGTVDENTKPKIEQNDDLSATVSTGNALVVEEGEQNRNADLAKVSGEETTSNEKIDFTEQQQPESQQNQENLPKNNTDVAVNEETVIQDEVPQSETSSAEHALDGEDKGRSFPWLVIPTLLLCVIGYFGADWWEEESKVNSANCTEVPIGWVPQGYQPPSQPSAEKPAEIKDGGSVSTSNSANNTPSTNTASADLPSSTSSDHSLQRSNSTKAEKSRSKSKSKSKEPIPQIVEPITKKNSSESSDNASSSGNASKREPKLKTNSTEKSPHHHTHHKEHHHHESSHSDEKEKSEPSTHEHHPHPHHQHQHHNGGDNKEEPPKDEHK